MTGVAQACGLDCTSRPQREAFDPAALARAILTAAETLFADIRWPQRLLAMEEDDAFAAYGLDDGAQNAVMRQIDTAIRHLDAAEAGRFFGFDSKRRAYVCSTCYYWANRDWQDDWPALAQFPEKQPGSTHLHCIVCDETSAVERVACTNADCPADVIHEGMCLTCMSSQDDPRLLPHAPLETVAETVRYNFDFGRGLHGWGGTRTTDTREFPNDEAAREYGRSALSKAHLLAWATVTIMEYNPLGALRLPGNGRDRLLGTGFVARLF